MTSVRITAVVPVFNRVDLIGRCVDSIRAQTRPPDEIVVVDDGSTDGSGDVAESLPGVTVARQQNGGAGAARTTGLRVASGEWVAFLDSDDTWTPDHLARIEDAIEATEGRAALYFDDTIRGTAEGGGSHFGHAGFDVGASHRLVDDGVDWMMMPLQPAMLQASVVARTAALDIGGFRDLSPRDDTDFFFRIGVGRAACAVDGIGTVMTDDATVRLGDRGERKSRRYLEATVTMYADILDQPSLTRAHRTTVRRRLASAHARLGAADVRERKLASGLGHFARGVVVEPRIVASILLDRVRPRTG